MNAKWNQTGFDSTDDLDSADGADMADRADVEADVNASDYNASDYHASDYHAAESTTTDRDPILVPHDDVVMIDDDDDPALDGSAEPVDPELDSPATQVVTADESVSPVNLASPVSSMSQPLAADNGTTTASTASTASTDLGSNNDARWHDIVAGFIDDPRGSVAEAADLVEADVSAFIAMLSKRRDGMGGGWQSEGSADSGTATEDLRIALRSSRDFSRQIADSTKALS
jgi:hypothetical protein